MTRAEQIGPYLLGLYELELHAAWNEVLTNSYSQIIDVGSKIGYYAVGLARKYPASRIFAFDTDPWARRVLKEMAKANDTTNVEIRGYCDAGWLASNLQEQSLIVSDCEGYEGELFCSTLIPNLASATLIIETHENIVPGVTGRLRDLLGSTHHLTTIPTTHDARWPPPAVDLSGLSASEWSLATQEVRPPQVWLLGQPSGKSHAALQSGEGIS